MCCSVQTNINQFCLFFSVLLKKKLSEGNLPWAPTGETGGETGRSDHHAVLFTR